MVELLYKKASDSAIAAKKQNENDLKLISDKKDKEQVALANMKNELSLAEKKRKLTTPQLTAFNERIKIIERNISDLDAERQKKLRELLHDEADILVKANEAQAQVDADATKAEADAKAIQDKAVVDANTKVLEEQANFIRKGADGHGLSEGEIDGLMDGVFLHQFEPFKNSTRDAKKRQIATEAKALAKTKKDEEDALTKEAEARVKKTTDSLVSKLNKSKGAYEANEIKVTRSKQQAAIRKILSDNGVPVKAVDNFMDLNYPSEGLPKDFETPRKAATKLAQATKKTNEEAAEVKRLADEDTRTAQSRADAEKEKSMDLRSTQETKARDHLGQLEGLSEGEVNSIIHKVFPLGSEPMEEKNFSKLSTTLSREAAPFISSRRKEAEKSAEADRKSLEKESADADAKTSAETMATENLAKLREQEDKLFQVFKDKKASDEAALDWIVDNFSELKTAIKDEGGAWNSFHAKASKEASRIAESEEKDRADAIAREQSSIYDEAKLQDDAFESNRRAEENAVELDFQEAQIKEVFLRKIEDKDAANDASHEWLMDNFNKIQTAIRTDNTNWQSWYSKAAKAADAWNKQDEKISSAAFKKSVEGLTPDQLKGFIKQFTTEQMGNLDESMDDLASMSKKFKAFQKAKKELAMDLSTEDEKVIDSMDHILGSALEMKSKYPDREELWVTWDDLNKVKSAYRGAGYVGSNVGSLWKNIRAAVYGRTSDRDFITNSLREDLIKSGKRAKSSDYKDFDESGDTTTGFKRTASGQEVPVRSSGSNRYRANKRKSEGTSEDSKKSEAAPEEEEVKEAPKTETPVERPEGSPFVTPKEGYSPSKDSTIGDLNNSIKKISGMTDAKKEKWYKINADYIHGVLTQDEVIKALKDL